MLRPPHENVATVLVDPTILAELEIELMQHDLRLWPVSTAPVSVDGPRQAFQLRRRMLEARRGAWDDAAEWVPVWISFGDSWRDGRSRSRGPHAPASTTPWTRTPRASATARASSAFHRSSFLASAPPGPTSPDLSGGPDKLERRCHWLAPQWMYGLHGCGEPTCISRRITVT